MKLNLSSLENQAFWAEHRVRLPRLDIGEMRKATEKAPVWLHFGPGNIFRAFLAPLQQTLLEKGLQYSGILAAECFDEEIVDRIALPHDDLSLVISLSANGETDRSVVAVGKTVKTFAEDGRAVLLDAVRNPSLQMISFTITEKGYALKDLHGAYLPLLSPDLTAAPFNARHPMAFTAYLLYERWLAGAAPIAVVSMDNCSRNGEKLRSAILTICGEWLARDTVPEAFTRWLSDESMVSFPWTMIDKITPRPDPSIAAQLEREGIEDMQPVVTAKKSCAAPFVNAEVPQYLVIEDRFPNGRPPLEQCGVYFGNRETVSLSEQMKVNTCLNPLHTSLAIFGCLLGYTSIAREMLDPDLRALVHRIGFIEGLPVVVHPGIIEPKQFLKEVLEQRLPNPAIPDTPQRIATDTSQKMSIRYGETIRSYLGKGLDTTHLSGIALTIAGWLRYLLAYDDMLEEMALSADPLLSELQPLLSGISQSNAGHKLIPILSNEAIFGLNLVQTPLFDIILQDFTDMLKGKNAVRDTIRRVLAKCFREGN